MSDDAKLVRQVSRAINDFGAELTVLRVILKLLVAQILVLQPDLCEERTEQMKAEAMGVLGRLPANQANSPEEERRSRALAVQHGEKFFRDLAEAVSEMRNRFGQSGRH
jgi:hypothetical protein